MFVIVVSRFRRERMPGEGGPEEEPRGGSGGGGSARAQERRKSRPRAHPGRPRRPLKRGAGGARDRRPLTVPASGDARSEVSPAGRGGRRTHGPPGPHPGTGNEATRAPPPRLTNVKFIPPPVKRGRLRVYSPARPGCFYCLPARPQGPGGRMGPSGGSQSFRHKADPQL